MTVFLVQVSGGESTHNETKATKWWQEPIEEGVFIHHDWKNRKERSVWESIREGDEVLVYCTGSVEPYPFRISQLASCKDKNGNYVVIEFKAGEAGYDALGQLVSYKGALKKKTGGIPGES